MAGMRWIVRSSHKKGKKKGKRMRGSPSFDAGVNLLLLLFPVPSAPIHFTFNFPLGYTYIYIGLAALSGPRKTGASLSTYLSTYIVCDPASAPTPGFI